MERKYNIVMIISDEQRKDTMGCYKNPANVTPNLDRLADRGIVFDRCYTPYPLCNPARASLWAGVMANRHNVTGNWRLIDPAYEMGQLVPSFAENGYHTIYTGKWHVQGTTPEKMGFSFCNAIPVTYEERQRGRRITEYREYAAKMGYEILPESGENLTKEDKKKLRQPGKAPCGTAEIKYEHFLETWQTGKFIEALDKRPDGKPFFAVCSYNAPHFPMIVPSPYDSLIKPEDVVLPDNFLKGIEGKPAEVLSSHYFTKNTELDEYEWRRLIAHYWGLCALVDNEVGRVVSYLEKQGLLDNTIIVYTTDHGDMMGSHGMDKKGYPMHYEEDICIPLIISHPEDMKQRRYNGFMSLMDILPTVGELAGVEMDYKDTDTLSYAGLWKNADFRAPRDFVVTETFFMDGHESGRDDRIDVASFKEERDKAILSICTKKYKYIFHSHDEDELYDIMEDIGENYNIAGKCEMATVIEELRNKLFDSIEKGNPVFAKLMRKIADNKEF